jgi:hypothetical protein
MDCFHWILNCYCYGLGPYVLLIGLIVLSTFIAAFGKLYLKQRGVDCKADSGGRLRLVWETGSHI